MPRASGVHRAIAIAEKKLPGREVRSMSRINPRWQAIIAVGDYIETDPIPVCDFALKWARRRGRDLQAAIYCCLIEHLLEHHFNLVLPRMRTAAREDARVAKHFVGMWWLLGQAKKPANIKRLKRLESELRRIHSDLPG